ncbi:RNA binding motif protein 11 isoform X2 [Pimephales promelas]|uniref:RNA binding motif protein 11 isoform X2 n=1 Tax=Pimephales promelas TaxID=90988 RepID=UPI001955AC19|nr:RNA binding motif protein 11 isoform X2 [Pimephales promelas]
MQWYIMFDRVRDLDKTILVGNIHSCVTEEILFELFLQAGPVKEVHIFRDGQQAPYGCVYYKHAEAVPYAVELLNGIWLYGQPIKLQCKIGGHYHRNHMLAYHMENGLIANSADAVHQDNMVLNLNGSPAGVENRSNEACGWSDMVYSSRPLDACPPVVWYCPPLQQWGNSGYPPWTSRLDEDLLLYRSASTREGCANRQKYSGRCTGILTPLAQKSTPYIPVSAFGGTDSDCKL